VAGARGLQMVMLDDVILSGRVRGPSAGLDRVVKAPVTSQLLPRGEGCTCAGGRPERFFSILREHSSYHFLLLAFCLQLSAYFLLPTADLTPPTRCAGELR
jgi:hypothetical protein